MKKILLTVLVLLVALIGIGYALPNRFEIRAKRTIGVAPERIHRQVGDLKTWKEWSVWGSAQRDAEWTYENGGRGAGAAMSWEGQEVGGGRLEIGSSVPDEGIGYRLEFADLGSSRGGIRYSEVEDGTRVVWVEEGRVESLILRPIFGWILLLKGTDGMAAMYDESLAKLAERVEGPDGGPVEAADDR